MYRLAKEIKKQSHDNCYNAEDPAPVESSPSQDLLEVDQPGATINSPASASAPGTHHGDARSTPRSPLGYARRPRVNGDDDSSTIGDSRGDASALSVSKFKSHDSDDEDLLTNFGLDYLSEAACKSANDEKDRAPTFISRIFPSDEHASLAPSKWGGLLRAGDEELMGQQKELEYHQELQQEMENVLNQLQQQGPGKTRKIPRRSELVQRQQRILNEAQIQHAAPNQAEEPPHLETQTEEQVLLLSSQPGSVSESASPSARAPPSLAERWKWFLAVLRATPFNKMDNDLYHTILEIRNRAAVQNPPWDITNLPNPQQYADLNTFILQTRGLRLADMRSFDISGKDDREYEDAMQILEFLHKYGQGQGTAGMMCMSSQPAEFSVGMASAAVVGMGSAPSRLERIDSMTGRPYYLPVWRPSTTAFASTPTEKKRWWKKNPKAKPLVRVASKKEWQGSAPATTPPLGGTQTTLRPDLDRIGINTPHPKATPSTKPCLKPPPLQAASVSGPTPVPASATVAAAPAAEEIMPTNSLANALEEPGDVSSAISSFTPGIGNVQNAAGKPEDHMDDESVEQDDQKHDAYLLDHEGTRKYDLGGGNPFTKPQSKGELTDTGSRLSGPQVKCGDPDFPRRESSSAPPIQEVILPPTRNLGMPEWQKISDMTMDHRIVGKTDTEKPQVRLTSGPSYDPPPRGSSLPPKRQPSTTTIDIPAEDVSLIGINIPAEDVSLLGSIKAEGNLAPVSASIPIAAKVTQAVSIGAKKSSSQFCAWEKKLDTNQPTFVDAVAEEGDLHEDGLVEAHLIEEVQPPYVNRTKTDWRYNIDEQVEVRNYEMAWHPTLVDDHVNVYERQKDESARSRNNVFSYRTRGQHSGIYECENNKVFAVLLRNGNVTTGSVNHDPRVAEGEVHIRLPQEGLIQIYGIGPWIWQRWAAMQIEHELRFQEGHEKDFVNFDIPGYALDLWNVWIRHPNNELFRDFYDGTGPFAQEELMRHVMDPFTLCKSIIRDEKKWDFHSTSEFSVYLYLSVTGSGFWISIFVLLVQIFIPVSLLMFYLSRTEAEGDPDAFDTRMMIVVGAIYYLIKVVTDIKHKLQQQSQPQPSILSRVISIRRVMRQENVGTPLQNIGHLINLHANTTLLLLLYFFNLFILFQSSNAFEVFGNIVLFEFVHNLDESLAASPWWDEDRRYMRAGVVENILALTIRPRECASPKKFMDYFRGCVGMSNAETIYMDQVQRDLGRITVCGLHFESEEDIEACTFAIPRLLTVLSGYFLLNAHTNIMERPGNEEKTILDFRLRPIAKRVEYLSNRQKKPYHFMPWSVVGRPFFDRHQELKNWKIWEAVVFVALPLNAYGQGCRAVRSAKTTMSTIQLAWVPPVLVFLFPFAVIAALVIPFTPAHKLVRVNQDM